MTAVYAEMGTCSRGCQAPAEVPWSGLRLCWDCADNELDRLALACQSEDGLPVTVGKGVTTPGHEVYVSMESYRSGHYHDPSGRYDYCDDPRCPRSAPVEDRLTEEVARLYLAAAGGDPELAAELVRGSDYLKQEACCV